MEPEVGFEPTTFRLRGGTSQSDTSEGDGSSLLTWDTASIWSDPAGYGSIVWMTIRMTMAHPISGRMTDAGCCTTAVAGAHAHRGSSPTRYVIAVRDRRGA